MFSTTGKVPWAWTLNNASHNHVFNISNNTVGGIQDKDEFNRISIGLPYPLHNSILNDYGSIDVVQKLVDDKKSYEEYVAKTKRQFSSKDIEKRKHEGKNHGKRFVQMPRGLLMLYAAEDPDKYFSSDYNIYYTGGFLEHFESSNQYFLRVINNEIIMNSVEDNSCIAKISSHNGEILGLHIAVFQDTYLCVREKFCIRIFKFQTPFVYNELCNVNFSEPLLDAKINKHTRLPEVVGISQANSKFVVKNFVDNVMLFCYENNFEAEDNLQIFEFSDSQHVWLMDRCSIKFIDYSKKEQLLEFKPDLVFCDSFCNLMFLPQHTLLPASRHHVFESDIRNIKNYSYFSHTLQQAPTLMDVYSNEEDTYLCLSSHLPDDKIMFSGSLPFGIFGIPKEVPGIKATLQECALRNEKLVLLPDTQDIFSYSTAGLKIINVGGDTFIYSCDALGRIFRQKISASHSDVEEPVHCLTDFLDHMSFDQKLHITGFADMSTARFELNAEPYDETLDEITSAPNIDHFLGKHEPLIDKAKFSLIGQHLLSAWADSDEDEGDYVDQKPHMPEMPAYEKVNSWIQSVLPNNDPDDP